jgi:Mrp family chromosome partitioning ATPase
MSRMLEALKRIEDRRTHAPQHPDPGPPTPQDQGPPRLAPAPAATQAEQTFERLEAAVALAAQATLAVDAVHSTAVPLLTPFLSSSTLPEHAASGILSLLSEAEEQDLLDALAPEDRGPCPDADAALLPPVWDDFSGQAEHGSGSRDAEHVPEAILADDNLNACHPMAAADAYTDLADRILQQLVPGRPAALLLTSPVGGEGKTSTLLRLAPVLAGRLERKVLAVDATISGPSLAGYVGGDAGDRKTRTRSGPAWTEWVRPTSVPHLSVLLGPKPGDNGYLEAGEAFDWGGILREMVRGYQLVLVDGPPLTSPLTAKIACCCEGTYLVVRLGQTTARAARQAAQRIQNARGRLLGCIVIE